MTPTIRLRALRALLGQAHGPVECGQPKSRQALRCWSSGSGSSFGSSFGVGASSSFALRPAAWPAVSRHASISALTSSSRQAAAFYSTTPTSSSSSSSSSSSPASASASAASVEPPRTAPVLAPDAANPPITTRPPHLALPDRAASASTVQHLMATGKAYLAFYKTGLRYLWTNTKLVRALPPARTAHATRADLLLQHRWCHDMRRLPLFVLLLLVCGETTPLVVLVFPHVVPYPCRIPKQVDKLRRLTEERRHAAFVDLDGRMQAQMQTQMQAPTPTGTPASSTVPVPVPAHLACSHIARSLGLVSPLWDRIGWVPSGLARWRTTHRLRELAEDDALLRECGGVAALEAEEVRLACVDRGLDVRGVADLQLQEQLATWLQLTATPTAEPAPSRDGGGGDKDGAEQRRMTLLTRRPERWHQQ